MPQPKKHNNAKRKNKPEYSVQQLKSMAASKEIMREILCSEEGKYPVTSLAELRVTLPFWSRDGQRQHHPEGSHLQPRGVEKLP